MSLSVLINLLLGLAMAVSCTRAPVKDKADALRQARMAPPLDDDLPLAPLVEALGRHVTRLSQNPETRLTFGKVSLSSSEYAQALEGLLEAYRKNPTNETFFQYTSEHFDFFEVYGGDRWGEILLTAYYESDIPGSLTKTTRFTQALYGVPQDLLEVIAPKGDSRFSGISNMRGRLARHPASKRTQVLPYYSRIEIDHQGALERRVPILAWVDPIDAFFLQIQGTGTVHFSNGTHKRFGYADQNGHAYEPIGRFISDIVPLEKLTLHTIEEYLRTVPPDLAKHLLYRNPSYVFFKELAGPAMTSFSVEAVPGRTIATDQRFFPKGALAFMVFERPEFDAPEAQTASAWIPSSRFVLDEDSGGAIKGTGRADLFWGRGEQAKQAAGVVKNPAYLFYLVPK